MSTRVNHVFTSSRVERRARLPRSHGLPVFVLMVLPLAHVYNATTKCDKLSVDSSRVHSREGSLWCVEAGCHPSRQVIGWPSASAATRDTGPSARPYAPTRDHGRSLSCPV